MSFNDPSNEAARCTGCRGIFLLHELWLPDRGGFNRWCAACMKANGETIRRG